MVDVEQGLVLLGGTEMAVRWNRERCKMGEGSKERSKKNLFPK